MLVLTRKVGEKILIGDDVIVSVVEISRGGVRIGVEAPQHLSILRYEVYERIREENIIAARGAMSAMDIQHAAALFKRPGVKPETSVEKDG